MKEIRDWKALVENHQWQMEQQNNGASGSLKDMENSIDFVSEQYDGFPAFQKAVSTRLKELSASLNTISKKVNDLAQAIDNLEAYSYRYNLKLVGIPELPDETATATANVCVLGASVTTNDIDIAHRVSKRSTRSEDERSSHNAIVCKFTRRRTHSRDNAAKSSNLHDKSFWKWFARWCAFNLSKNFRGLNENYNSYSTNQKSVNNN